MTGDGEGLTVLDWRFPIRLTQPAPIWQQTLLGTGNADLIMRQTTRAAQWDLLVEERFVRAVAEETAPMAVVPAGPVYPELAPAVLEETAPVLGGVAAVYAEPEPPRRRWWGRRAA